MFSLHFIFIVVICIGYSNASKIPIHKNDSKTSTTKIINPSDIKCHEVKIKEFLINCTYIGFHLNSRNDTIKKGKIIKKN